LLATRKSTRETAAPCALVTIRHTHRAVQFYNSKYFAFVVIVVRGHCISKVHSLNQNKPVGNMRESLSACMWSCCSGTAQ